MREILFRGKAINRDKGYHLTEYKNGEWVYGLVTKLYDEQFKSLPAEMTNTNGISGIEIDYKTIGQYTGLNDKNGTKIFEGDICKFESDIEEFTNYEILWHVNKWVALACEENIADVLDLFFCDRSVVIGNIHDNPEFLEA